MSNLKSHTIDYIVLALILILSAATIWFYRFTDTTTKFVAVFLTAGYFIWGVAHHKKKGHIDKKIVLEYLGMSLLALAIVFSLL